MFVSPMLPLCGSGCGPAAGTLRPGRMARRGSNASLIFGKWRWAGGSGSVETTHGLALRNDGMVVARGRNHWRQAEVPADLPKAMVVAAGLYHRLAILRELPPVISGQPQSRLVNTGETVTLATAINGSPLLSCQ